MAGTSIGPVNVMLSADPSGITKGVQEGTKELQKLGGAPLKINDVEIDDKATKRIDARLTRKIQKAALYGTDPELARQVQLAGLERQSSRAFRVAEAQSRYGRLGALSANIGNTTAEVADFMAAMAPLAGSIGLVTAAAGAMIALGKRADPIASEAFDNAWNDFVAALGENFVPVLKEATEWLRWMGDFVKDHNPTDENGKSKGWVSTFIEAGQGLLKDAFHIPFAEELGLEKTSLYDPSEARKLGESMGSSGSARGLGDKKAAFRFMDIGSFGEGAMLAALGSGRDYGRETVDKLDEISGKLDPKPNGEGNSRGLQGYSGSGN